MSCCDCGCVLCSDPDKYKVCETCFEKRAIYGMKGQRQKKFCQDCVPSDSNIVNLNDKKCIDCKDKRAYYGSAEEGVLIAGVVPGSPADQAGIQRGDVIVQWNGTTLKSPASLSRTVAATQVGKTVRVKLYRQGVLINVRVKVAERPPQFG